jgi:hypothetical protein
MCHLCFSRTSLLLIQQHLTWKVAWKSWSLWTRSLRF